MSYKKEVVSLSIHQGVDILLVGCAFWAAFYTKKFLLPFGLAGLAGDVGYEITFLVCVIIYHLCFRLFGCYTQPGRNGLRKIIFNTLKVCMTGTMVSIIVIYLFHLQDLSRLLMALFTVYAIVLLILLKTLISLFLRRIKGMAVDAQKILIIGCRERAIDFIKAVFAEPDSGYDVLGCLDTVEEQESVGKTIYKGVKVIGTLGDFKNIMEWNPVDELVFAMPLENIADVHTYFYYAEDMGVTIRIVPDFQIDRIKYLPKTAKTSLRTFLSVPTITLSSLPSKELELAIKVVIDYVGAVLGLIITSPLWLVIAILIKMTSKGAVIFSQERLGKNGRRFRVYKFRTMVENAEELKAGLEDMNEVDGPVFKMKKDPRITRVGAFLRRTSLDELPQLLNIIKGEMSLVGPRPPVPQEVVKYEIWQRRRLSMKPGITCIWQVSGRNEVGFDEWMAMDLEYIDNWSLILDIKLLFKTVREVLRCGGR